jgi:phage shock protein PspC (stress-responsive transcriptional regulator)
MIAGVAGGLGRYFGVDPILFRIGLVALTFFGGTGFFVYAAIVLFVPVEGSTAQPLGIRFFHGDREVWKRIGLVAAVLVASALAAVASAWATGTGSGGYVAGAAIVLGLALVVAAFRGGARWLILPALAVALPAGVVSAAGADFHGGVGEKAYRPATLQEVRDSYRLGVGHLEVDLRDVRFPAADRALELRLGTGHAELIVPREVCVATRARVGAGYVGALDRDAGGLDLDWTNQPTPPRGVPRLVVDADVGMGALTISDRPLGRHDRDFEPGRYGTNDACRGRPAEVR